MGDHPSWVLYAHYLATLAAAAAAEVTNSPCTTSMVNMNARSHQILLIVLDQSHLTPLSTHAHHAFIEALVGAAQQSVPVSSEE
jgi:hypothetical protein